MSENPQANDAPAPLDPSQLQPEDTLVQEDVEDVLDRGYSPPDVDRSEQHGPTVQEQLDGETIEDRISQEVPDPDSAYGRPVDESGLDEPRVGGDDPDAIDAEQDWLGDAEVGDDRSGRVVAPDAGAGSDDEKELVGEDVGVDGAAASAEEAALHVVDEETAEE